MLKRINLQQLKKWLFLTFLTVSAALVLFYLSIYLGFWGPIPTESELRNLEQNQATEVFASGGELLGKYYIYDRQPVKFEELPPHLVDALIATEDVRFYQHEGVDTRSLFRVFFKTILMGDASSGGGSTITLQLAKNLFGRRDYGPFDIVIHKIREAIVAGRLEEIHSKEKILELYFNTVPFSDNTYGIESASRKFFSKKASELNLEEAATLVGTLKASHYYNPRLFPERSRQRRNVVLDQMNKYGYLSDEDLVFSSKLPIDLDYQFFGNNSGVAPYFRAQLKKELNKILDTLGAKGEQYDIYRDGLKVYTTLDYKMQVLAEEVMAEHMSALQKDFENQYGSRAPWKDEKLFSSVLRKTPVYESLQQKGWTTAEIMDSLHRKKEMQLFDWNKSKVINASIADSVRHYLKFLNMGMINLDPATGAVKSWVGGINHRYFKYDHVAQSRRQVGSTFKPVVYTAALEAGLDPCSYFSAREITYSDGWTPSNSGSADDPYMNYPMQTALSHSINTIAVKVLRETGLERVLAQAKKMGFPPGLPEVPSIALGTAEASVAQLAGAYASYANHGKPVVPFYISRIEDKEGNILARFAPLVAEEPAFSEVTNQLMIEMMQSTVEEGTAKRLRTRYGLRNDIAAKTGTTQNNKDGWFVAVTPKLVSVTWAGADDHRIGFPSTAIGQGANSALPAFALLMQKMNQDSYFEELTAAEFEEPSEMVRQMLDCPPSKKDNFLERLLIDKTIPKKADKKTKSGLFSKIRGWFSN